MTRYRVGIPAAAYITINVETDDPEDAIEAAMHAEQPYICAQCSGWNRDYSLDLSDDWGWDDAEVTEV